MPAGRGQLGLGAALVAAAVLGAVGLTGQNGASAPGGSAAPGGSGPVASPPVASGPAASYLQGGIDNGGGTGQASDGPHTPRGRSVAFFDPVMQDVLNLAVIEGLLQDEDYLDADWYDDGTLTGHAAATVATFKQLGKAGIAIVDAYGDGQVLAVEQFCDPLAAVHVLETQYDADLAAGYLMITDIPGTASCGSVLNNDRNDWVSKITQSDPNRITVHFMDGIPDPGPVRWAIGVTPNGLEAYLGNDELSLLYLASCKGATLASGLTIDAVFGYTGCSPYATDAVRLFKSMYGWDGVGFRATDTAFEHIKGAASGLTYRQVAGPVLLSPAVVDVDPLAKAVPQDDSTQFTVTFDTEMDPSGAPAAVSGCGAEIDGDQVWSADHTVLQFTVKVPAVPFTDELEIKIRHEDAEADPDTGWANELSGNERLPEANGIGPNKNDYVWKVSCGKALNLYVEGTIGGKHVSGSIVGYPTPRLTCEPITNAFGVTGNAVHWTGDASESNTQLGGEFDVPFGTWPIGDAIGDQSITINVLQPYKLLGGTSGTITSNADGGSINAVASSGADTITISGSWSCDGASPAP